MRARRPAVSGMFYAGTAKQLEEQIEWCYKHELGPGAVPRVNSSGLRQIVGIVVPHAGYYYSGPVAAHAYKELARDGAPDTAVILGPNHTGYGPPVSVWVGSAWSTPLGDVEINEALAGRLLGDVIKADETAHLHEHSIEVQLPWLQHLYERVKIVPIAMLAQDMETARALGRAISQSDDDLIVIASSDFTHYEPHTVAMEKDGSIIDAIIGLDEEELYERCERLRCTMCGYGPVTSAIVAAKETGAKRASLLKYATSGDMTGDYSRVVGYGSIVMRR
jgi:AmmeMemoRadiSam system protein B